MNKLDQAVIDLHNTARIIEKELSKDSELAKELRVIADKLAELVKETI